MSRRRRQTSPHRQVRQSTPASRAARILLPRLFDTALAKAVAWRDTGHAEDLHQFRVATRRYRATVRLFKPLLKPKPFRRVMKALDRLARVTGPVRDAEVVARIWSNGPDLTPDGATDRERLRGFLAGRRFAELQKAVDELQNSGFADDPRSGQPSLADFVTSRMRVHMDRLARIDLPGLLARPRRVHTVRKRVRRLRYWAELAAPHCVAAMAEMAVRLHDSATALGELHDVDMALGTRGGDRRRVRQLRHRRAKKAVETWRALTGHCGIRLARLAMGRPLAKEAP